MEKKENEVNVLDELHKGACMGQDAIHFVLEKVKDEELKKVLHNQYNDYKSIAREIEEIYPEYASKEPHETSTMNKVMTWYNIEMKTFSDDTTSKIAELLVQGVNMGIIEGRRLLNHKETDTQVHDLVEKYVIMQEGALEELKKFL